MASENALATFTQQGSLDWVALSNTQFSASVAVLSRLAGAGVEPLTIAFGQAMCSMVPLTLHGEIVLHEAMSGLKAFSSFSDLVWFGVGVRHVLRDLVQNAQGSALVAHCAALAEGHSVDVAALVMYELGKATSSPEELRPSFQQWRSLVKVSACVFIGTTLGLRIGQMMDLSGLPRPLRRGHRTSSNDEVMPSSTHPEDLARVMIAVGKVARGTIESVTIEGQGSASWVAGWADFVLGLRVEVHSVDERIVYRNFDPIVASAQLVITFSPKFHHRSLIRQHSQTIVLRDGFAFIEKFFLRTNYDEGGRYISTFIESRLSWEHMLRSTFGDGFTKMIDPSEKQLFTEGKMLELSGLTKPVSISTARLFAKVFIINIKLLVSYTMIRCRHKSVSDFLHRTFDLISELLPVRAECFEEAQTMDAMDLAEESLRSCYAQAACRLRLRCGCSTCLNYPSLTASRSSRPEICIVTLVDTIALLASILNCIVLDSPICPLRSAILKLYESSWSGKSQLHDQPTVLSFHPETYSFGMVLFTSSISDWVSRTSAKSDGKVYGYLETTLHLTDSQDEAVLFHIGSGSINRGHRHYDQISDLSEDEQAGVAPRHRCTYYADSSTTTSGFAQLEQDSSSPDLVVEAVVRERVDAIAFGYRASSHKGFTTISPYLFTKLLFKASSYQYSRVRSFLVPDLITDHIAELQHISVTGEGRVKRARGNRDDKRPVFFYRLHRGNLLGRCVALWSTRGNVALVKNKEELQMFQRYWLDKWHKDDGRVVSKDAQFSIVS